MLLGGRRKRSAASHGVPHPSVLRLRVLTYLSFVQCCASPPREAFLLYTAGCLHGHRALLAKQSQNSTLRRLLCPLLFQRTACPCVRLPSRMAAVAALLAPANIPASASTTPKKKPAPAPQKNSAKTWATSSPATTSPLATSVL